MSTPFLAETCTTQTIKINVNEIPDIDRRKIAEAGSAMLARFFADPVINKKIDDRLAKRKAESKSRGDSHV
ncbi:hypothetical protein RFF05_06560 [Bengtsoniella intestinalis]|uniref:hypothetical protein n=1 Tax=Bengtsoniella intestinalis TaxID=3073143 RepID=UPI00391F1A0C